MRGPVGGIDRPPAVMPLDRRKVSLISEFLEESFVGCSVYDYEDKDRVAQSYRIINDTTGTVLHHVFVPREFLTITLRPRSFRRCRTSPSSCVSQWPEPDLSLREAR